MIGTFVMALVLIAAGIFAAITGVVKAREQKGKESLWFIAILLGAAGIAAGIFWLSIAMVVLSAPVFR